MILIAELSELKPNGGSNIDYAPISCWLARTCRIVSVIWELAVLSERSWVVRRRSRAYIYSQYNVREAVKTVNK